MSVKQASIKKFVIALIAGWLIMIIAQSFILNTFNFPLYIIFTDSIVSNTLLLGAAFLMLNITRYYSPSSYQYTSVIGACLILAGLWLFVANSFLKILINDSDVYNSFLRNSLAYRCGVAFLLLAIVTIAAILWQNWMEQQVNIQRQADTEKLSREAELFKLRQQLQPHFLFNSLNSINALIGIDPAQARKMVQQLSDFLRGTLKKEESQFVTLEEEINYLGLYLDIEKVRFGNRLITEILLSDDSKNQLIPTLLLQPIVENAIKFGLYDTTGETLITINCSVHNHELLITVTNPFDPETALPQNKGTGFGLSSIKRRLYLLFGRNDLLETRFGNTIFETIVKIPQQHEQSNNH